LQVGIHRESSVVDRGVVVVLRQTLVPF
jgi:hypothetical protein